MSPRTWRPALTGLAATLALTLAVAACDGTNLFKVGYGVVSEQGPVVQIASPAPGASVPSGQPLTVAANVQANAGIKSVAFEGITVSTDSLNNTLAYAPVVMSFPQAGSTKLPTDTLLQANLTPTSNLQSDSVYIVVTAVDSLGQEAADTVGVTVGPLTMLRTPTNGQWAQAARTGVSMRIATASVAAGGNHVTTTPSGAVDRTTRRPALNDRVVAWGPPESSAGAAARAGPC